MKPPTDAIRLTQADRDRLIRIKRATGIESWNILCRWALIIGLRENQNKALEPEESRNALEIKWDTFAGSESRLYNCLIEWSFRKAAWAHGGSVGHYVHGCISHGLLVLSKPGTINNISSMAHIGMR